MTSELEKRLGYPLQAPRPYEFTHNGDRYGWMQGQDGHWHYTLFIENGRVKDADGLSLLSGLREIARVHSGEFRLTGNQNLIIANVPTDRRGYIEELLTQYGMDNRRYSAMRRSAMACVAFPTCGLAMAESERYLPQLLDKLEGILEEVGLSKESITVRMSGCPNGCSRPYIGEIGFSGRGPGKYNVYLGGGFHGQRLNKLYLNNVDEEAILQGLRPIIHRYASERYEGEPFGDYVTRAGYLNEYLDAPNGILR